MYIINKMENNNILKTCTHCYSQFKSKYYMNLHQTTQKCKLAKDKNLARIEIAEMIKEEEREKDKEFDEYLDNLDDNRLARRIFE